MCPSICPSTFQHVPALHALTPADMNKYDRQIRMWSKSGQSALSNAHVLVLGLRTTTTEMIKCLALSGVAHITVCDNSAVSRDSIASNFFCSGSLGSSITQAVLPQLAELNPDTTLDTVSDPGSLEQYTVICAANATTEQLQELYGPVPVVELCSFGFYGRVRAFYTQYTSYQLHPPTLVDLRFDWPELRQYLQEASIDNLDEYKHQNVPFTTILGKYFQRGVPATSADRKALKAELNSRAGPEGDNWREAANAAFHLWAQPTAQHLDLVDENLAQATPFWVLMGALREFVRETGAPPLSGVLPDMKTDTNYYVEVQQLYRAKAVADAEKIAEYASKIAAELEVPEPSPEQTRDFCKNARHLLVIDGQSPAANTAAIRAIEPSADPWDATMVRQKHIFCALETACAEKEWPISDNDVDPEVLHSLNRAAGGELNAVASMVGGMAAQEVTKLILSQYTPLQHTLVYDGIKSTAYTFA